MKLYNTLTRKIQTVEPLEEGKIKLFVCGPTVYDFSHLGNAKTYTQLDVLARVLRDAGYDVFYLQNITDIDDKILTRAAEQKIDWKQLTAKYKSEYLQDMNSLNNTAVSQYADATDYIDDIIRQVQTLMDKGHAYRTSDGIYFEISTFPDYGKLSGRKETQENDAQTRIDQSDEKRGWNDFCLWKFSKPDEPVWDAQFGAGRPGWHIEDTAITEHFFGPQYDIHGGAVDLIFPHHEAEITQMESASGRVPFVRYWTHTGFLTIDDRRMGKSLNNFYTTREVLEKGFDPMSIRLFMLQSHYRSGVNFSWDNLEAAANRLRSLSTMADRIWQPIDSGVDKATIAKSKSAIRAALQNDLNTPEALAVLSSLETSINKRGISISSQKDFAEFLSWIDDTLGLNLSNREDITAKQKEIIASRQQARDGGDWAKSDELRSQLTSEGIVIKDTSAGPIWNRT